MARAGALAWQSDLFFIRLMTCAMNSHHAYLGERRSPLRLMIGYHLGNPNIYLVRLLSGFGLR
ncbi:MAG: hypothetical protein EHM45_23360 [Desulfobacteraceae bacterium]|nr:MAG: hypothetical protein EHM45_23360 [Desulfobacteraceae bacterium]